MCQRKCFIPALLQESRATGVSSRVHSHSQGMLDWEGIDASAWLLEQLTALAIGMMGSQLQSMGTAAKGRSELRSAAWLQALQRRPRRAGCQPPGQTAAADGRHLCLLKDLAAQIRPMHGESVMIHPW